MTERTLDALRALAERPGTEAEGIVAREMLAKLESKEIAEPTEAECYALFSKYLRSGSIDDLMKACRLPSWCHCGTKHARGDSCQNHAEHERIRSEIRKRFPKNTITYYNYWAYHINSRARVTGYSDCWNWINVKFDHLKSYRSIPIYTTKGWHLSVEPVAPMEHERLARS